VTPIQVQRLAADPTPTQLTVVVVDSHFPVPPFVRAFVGLAPRVVLLAPTVAIAAWMRGGRDEAATGRALPVPGFVLAFLALVVVRTVVSVPAVVLTIDNWAVAILLGGALAALGLKTTVSSFRAAGGRPLLLGLGAWAVALLVSLGLLAALEVG